jgi:hypothetical protein
LVEYACPCCCRAGKTSGDNASNYRNMPWNNMYCKQCIVNKKWHMRLYLTRYIVLLPR